MTNSENAVKHFNNGISLLFEKDLDKEVNDNFYQKLIIDLNFIAKSNIEPTKDNTKIIKAKEEFLKAIELKPYFSISYNYLGIANYLLRQYENAIENFNIAVEIIPNYIDAFLNRGLVKSFKNRLNTNDIALADFNYAIKLDPTYFISYLKRGLHYFSKCDYSEAIPDFSKVIELNEKIIDVYSYRAEARNEIGDYLGAIEDLDIYIKSKEKEDCLFYYIMRGNAKVNANKILDAIKDYNEVIEYDDNKIDINLVNQALYSKINAKKKSKDYNGAIEDCEKLIKINNESDTTPIHQRGIIKFMMLDLNGALEDFNLAIEIHEKYYSLCEGEYYFDRGNVKYELKDYYGAIEDYKRAISDDYQNSIYYKKLGITKMKINDFKEAIRAFNFSINLSPNNSELYELRATAKEAIGDIEGTISDLKKVIEIMSLGK